MCVWLAKHAQLLPAPLKVPVFPQKTKIKYNNWLQWVFYNPVIVVYSVVVMWHGCYCGSDLAVVVKLAVVADVAAC